MIARAQERRCRGVNKMSDSFPYNPYTGFSAPVYFTTTVETLDYPLCQIDDFVYDNHLFELIIDKPCHPGGDCLYDDGWVYETIPNLDSDGNYIGPLGDPAPPYFTDSTFWYMKDIDGVDHPRGLLLRNGLAESAAWVYMTITGSPTFTWEGHTYTVLSLGDNLSRIKIPHAGMTGNPSVLNLWAQVTSNKDLVQRQDHLTPRLYCLNEFDQSTNTVKLELYVYLRLNSSSSLTYYKVKDLEFTFTNIGPSIFYESLVWDSGFGIVLNPILLTQTKRTGNGVAAYTPGYFTGYEATYIPNTNDEYVGSFGMSAPLYRSFLTQVGFPYVPQTGLWNGSWFASDFMDPAPPIMSEHGDWSTGSISFSADIRANKTEVVSDGPATWTFNISPRPLNSDLDVQRWRITAWIQYDTGAPNYHTWIQTYFYDNSANGNKVMFEGFTADAAGVVTGEVVLSKDDPVFTIPSSGVDTSNVLENLTWSTRSGFTYDFPPVSAIDSSFFGPSGLDANNGGRFWPRYLELSASNFEQLSSAPEFVDMEFIPVTANSLFSRTYMGNSTWSENVAGTDIYKFKKIDVTLDTRNRIYVTADLSDNIYGGRYDIPVNFSLTESVTLSTTGGETNSGLLHIKAII